MKLSSEKIKAFKLVRVTTVPISLEKLISGQMKFMGEKGLDVYMISSPFDGAAELEKKEKSSFIPVSMTRTISPIKDMLSLINLIFIFFKLKPAIVHTHTPKAGLLGMVACWIAGVPIRLHTVAGLPLMETSGLKRKILEAVERITYFCAVKVYPNSNNLKTFIVDSKFAKASKLKVIGNGSSNGIDTSFFKLTSDLMTLAKKLRNEYHSAENDFVYVFVGRLVRDKGVEELVNAFQRVNKAQPDTWLLLVGPPEPELDPLSADCIDQIEKNQRIIALGYQAEVKPWLAMSDALVFPSYREGFPNVPMQAGCFNLPAIVTNINGCNEIIENNKNGLIIPVKDTEALTEAMLSLLDKERYAGLKKNARQMINERYEQQVIWNLIYEEYQNHLKLKNLVS